MTLTLTMNKTNRSALAAAALLAATLLPSPTVLAALAPVAAPALAGNAGSGCCAPAPRAIDLALCLDTAIEEHHTPGWRAGVKAADLAGSYATARLRLSASAARPDARRRAVEGSGSAVRHAPTGRP